MRQLFVFIFVLSFFVVAAQNRETATLKDSLIIVNKNPTNGFYNDYVLFVPKGTPLHKKTFLLVEPNNTGFVSDSIAVHKKHAIDLASVSSVGNNVANWLKIPLLVPIFPRPALDSLIYTHALDRDAMLAKTPEIKRLDLQLLQMINDAKSILSRMNVVVDSKILMNGFSASASFTNRFSLLHPNQVKALAIGGFNGELMLPQNKINGILLDYPIGTNDFRQLFGKKFDLKSYRCVPQFVYMGQLDDNDAVQYDDAYSAEERKIINDNLGRSVQPRYFECQKIYNKQHINAIFKNYEGVGHWTTKSVSLDVIQFFEAQTQQ